MKKDEVTVEEKNDKNENQKFEEVEVYQEVEPRKKEVRIDSYFDGSLIELIGWRLLAFLITIVTLGIAGPWGSCMLYSYQIKHTVYNGKRLKFEGTGGDLFVNKFKWVLLTIITLGIYALFIPIKKTKWVISNIHFEDEEFVKEESFFDGKTIQLIGINLLCTFLNIITFGLVAPFTTCLKLRWINKHTVINRKKLVFNGKAIGLFGKQMLWNFLTIITFGIYGLWLPIKVLKWKSKHTHIKVVGETEQKDKSIFIAIPIVIIGIVILIAILPGIVKGIGNMFDNGIHSVEDVFESLSSGFVVGGGRDSSKLTESVMAPSTSTNGNKGNSSSKNTSTTKKPSTSTTTKKPSSSTSSVTTTTTKKTGYPTLKEIAEDYSINLTEDRYENGSSTKTDTQVASGVETISVSGGKIKYLGYTMSYNASSGYASASGSKGVIEAYFKYKNGKVTVNMRESIYNDNGIGIKLERAISGNKIS